MPGGDRLSFYSRTERKYRAHQLRPQPQPFIPYSYPHIHMRRFHDPCLMKGVGALPLDSRFLGSDLDSQKQETLVSLSAIWAW